MRHDTYALITVGGNTTWAIAFLLALSGASVVTGEDRTKMLRLKEPPLSWDIAALDKEMPYPWKAGSTHILLWEVIKEREHVHECCLVLKQYARPSDAGETCALGSFSRNPKDKKPIWTVDMMHLAPGGWRRGYECYKALPTDKEMGAFLQTWMWPVAVKPSVGYTLSDGKVVELHHNPQLIDGGLNGAAWKKVLGHEPSAKLFPEDRFPELTVRRKPAKK
jgi:hypothetical protein